MGREKVTDITDEGDARELRESNPDLKETMDLGRESEAGFPNPWPDRYDTGTDDSGAEFRREVLRFWELCNGLNQRVMRCLAVGMGYEERFFDEFTSGGDNTLRLLHYPQVGMEVFKGKGEQMRAGAHCDVRDSFILALRVEAGRGMEVANAFAVWDYHAPIPR